MGKPLQLRKFGRLIFILFRILALAYLGALIALLFRKNALIHPSSTAELPFLLQKATEADIQPWKNSAGEVIGWSSAPSIGVADYRCLFFHGNGGYALHRGGFIEGVRALAPRSSWEIYVLEYPGYGARPGPANEENLVAAGLEAVDILRATDRRPLFIMGQSLGASVAALVASKRPQQVSGLLLFTPFYNMMTEAQYLYPIFPMPLLIPQDYRSDRALQNYSGPIAFLVADEDETIPPRFGERLYDEYHGPKKIWHIPSAGHNSIPLSPTSAWWQEVFDFLTTNARITNL